MKSCRYITLLLLLTSGMMVFAQEQPVQEQPVQEQPVQEQPVQEQPVQEQPVQEQPVQNDPSQDEEDDGSLRQKDPTAPEDDEDEPTTERSYDENLYLKGQLNAQIKIGAYIPLYTHSFGWQSVGKINLKPGILLGVGIDAYLNNNVKLGGEINFSTSKGLNGSRAFFFPILFRAFYEFHVYSWSFPIGAGTGIQIGSYKGDMTYVTFVFRPEVGAVYKINKKFAVGAVATWSITPQPVWKDLDKSRVGNMLEVAICGQYYF